ncbi:hypothetical protein DV735_g4402, partial [Chaetothyriales sp. CBS 134920]
MALVDYSDSDTERQQPKPTTTCTKLVDRANPAKIRVQLAAAPATSSHDIDDEPDPKRPRTTPGGGAAAKRQLFGRGSSATTTRTTAAVTVTNFNTDHEYAANQELIAKGDQVVHNPVRAIAPGKHSLRQLVSAAQGQKDALEDSFAMGRRNKKEAGSKYGW